MLPADVRDWYRAHGANAHLAACDALGVVSFASTDSVSCTGNVSLGCSPAHNAGTATVDCTTGTPVEV